MIAGSDYISRYQLVTSGGGSGMQLSDVITSGDTVNESLSRITTMLATLIPEHDATQLAIGRATNADGTLKRALVY